MENLYLQRRKLGVSFVCAGRRCFWEQVIVCGRSRCRGKLSVKFEDLSQNLKFPTSGNSKLAVALTRSMCRG
ncbi:hypothetical protein H6S82_02995 [Planktothrix sp. FACHB-1355]|uniref:Uncharacterized protein n=1 Tax=Aerosakkonema funiforme FACHB-1375 TaxID=2949571 RepID=A0A926VD45_9CYAN|nr:MULTISPECIES: hypothetical protein [Oscillatoriales]MBD2181601.1 hypothetical protein [Aerosakkonema funiforme FACHB-1375]MBD3557823.1 hypothetical protein [Planktothrix sp. FACHB-1355]